MSVSFLTPEDRAKLVALDVPVAEEALLSEQALKRFSEDRMLHILSGEILVDTIPFTRLLMDLDHLAHQDTERLAQINVLEYQITQLKNVLDRLLQLLVEKEQNNVMFEITQMKDDLSRV